MTVAPNGLADLDGKRAWVTGASRGLGRDRRGAAGATIDVSMLDTPVALRSTSLVSTLNGLDPAPYPPLGPGYGVFRFGDESLITLSFEGEDHQWRALCEEISLTEIADLDTPAPKAPAAGLFDNIGQTNYGAAKMGLVGMTRVLALETDKYGIRCNAVAPIAATAMSAGLLGEGWLQRLRPELVSPVIAWLAQKTVLSTARSSRGPREGSRRYSLGRLPASTIPP